MKNFALLSAAGPVIPDARKGREYSTLRWLMSLGPETVIERLIRQCRNAELEPVIAIGVPGVGGWTPEFVKKIESFGYRLWVSPFLGGWESLQTMNFMLDRIAPELAAESKVFSFFCDWVFSDDLFKEVITYPAPCIYEFKQVDWTVVLTKDSIPSFLAISKSFEKEQKAYSTMWKTCICPGTTGRWKARGIHVREPRPDIHSSKRFVEIDYMFEFDDALELVAKDLSG